MLKKMGCLGIAMCAALSVVAENREDAGTSLESHLDHAIIAASPQNAHDKSVAHMSQEAEKVAKDLVKLPVTESAVILARMHPEKSSLVFSKLLHNLRYSFSKT